MYLSLTYVLCVLWLLSLCRFEPYTFVCLRIWDYWWQLLICIKFILIKPIKNIYLMLTFCILFLLAYSGCIVHSSNSAIFHNKYENSRYDQNHRYTLLCGTCVPKYEKSIYDEKEKKNHRYAVRYVSLTIIFWQ